MDSHPLALEVSKRIAVRRCGAWPIAGEALDVVLYGRELCAAFRAMGISSYQNFSVLQSIDLEDELWVVHM